MFRAQRDKILEGCLYTCVGPLKIFGSVKYEILVGNCGTYLFQYADTDQNGLIRDTDNYQLNIPDQYDANGTELSIGGAFPFINVIAASCDGCAVIKSFLSTTTTTYTTTAISADSTACKINLVEKSFSYTNFFIYID